MPQITLRATKLAARLRDQSAIEKPFAVWFLEGFQEAADLFSQFGRAAQVNRPPAAVGPPLGADSGGVHDTIANRH